MAIGVIAANRRRSGGAAWVPSGSISFIGSYIHGAGNGLAPTLAFSSLQDSSGSTPAVLQDDLVVAAWGLAGHPDQSMVPTTTGYTAIAENFVGPSGFPLNGWAGCKFMGSSPDSSLVLPAFGNSTTTSAGAIFVFRGVDPSTPLDGVSVAIAVPGAVPANTAKPNPGAVTPTSASGAWPIVVGFGAGPSSTAAYTNPGDLDAGTNSFRSIGIADNNTIHLGMGFKDDWTSGSFDPSTFTGGPTDAANMNWLAFTFVLRAG